MKKLVIVLFIVVLLSISAGYFLFQDKGLKWGGVELSTAEYNQLQKEFKDEVGYRVCNLESKQCILFVNIENYKENMKWQE